MTLGKWRREGLRGLWRERCRGEAATGGVPGTLSWSWSQGQGLAGGAQGAACPKPCLSPCLPGPRKAPDSGPHQSRWGRRAPGDPRPCWGVGEPTRTRRGQTLVLRSGASRTEPPSVPQGQTSLVGPDALNQHPPWPFSFSSTLDASRSSGSRRTAERGMEVARSLCLPFSLRQAGVGTAEGKPRPTHPAPVRSQGTREMDDVPSLRLGSKDSGTLESLRPYDGVLRREREPSAPRTTPAKPRPAPASPTLRLGPQPLRSRCRQQYSLGNSLLSPGGTSLTCSGCC